MQVLEEPFTIKEIKMLPIILLVLFSLLGNSVADAGTIAKSTKSFGGTSFINGVIPQASDFNTDIDTIYAEFNGNIDNNNIKSAAAIASSKLDISGGFTTNIRLTNNLPCYLIEENDEPADTRRTGFCLAGNQIMLRTFTDAGALQNTWFSMTRGTGGFQLGGVSGFNTIKGDTTFTGNTTFTGSTSFTPTGMVSSYMGAAAPAGWLLMNGASNSCTGALNVNVSLCAQLISLYATANYKGTAAATITVDTGSDEIIHTTHGLSVNDRVHFSSTGVLPDPLVATSIYCVTSITADRYKVGNICGSPLDLIDAGTGTHSDYYNFVTPNPAGRTIVAPGTMSTVETITGVTASGNAVEVGSNVSKWITGTPVAVSNASGFAGLVNGSFWIVRVDPTHIKIASSLANAQNGTVVTVTGTGSATFTYTGSTYVLTDIGGAETHAMSSTELLAHTHSYNNPNALTNVRAEAGSNWGPASGTTGSSGSNSAMNIMNPFFVMTYIIKL